MKPSCGFGGAAESGCVPADSADFAVPLALASGGGSSAPRTPQAARPSDRAATAMPTPMPFVVNLTRTSSLHSATPERQPHPKGAGATDKPFYRLGDPFSNRFRQLRAILRTFCGAVPP